MSAVGRRARQVHRKWQAYSIVAYFCCMSGQHAQHADCDIVLLFLSVRPSVTLYVVLYLSEGTYRTSNFSPPSATAPRRRYKIPTRTHSVGTLNARAGKVCDFGSEIAVYPGNNTR